MYPTKHPKQSWLPINCYIKYFTCDIHVYLSCEKYFDQLRKFKPNGASTKTTCLRTSICKNNELPISLNVYCPTIYF